VAEAHLSGLRDHPDLARDIGLLIADYAAIEILFFNLYAILSALPVEKIYGSFFSLRSVNRKCILTEEAALCLPAEFQRPIKRLIRRLKAAAARRTEIAHVHFMSTTGAPVRLHLIGEKINLTPIDDKFIARTADQYRNLGTDILSLSSYLMASNLQHFRTKLDAVNAPLDEQLRDIRPPRDHRKQLGADARAAAYERLGIAEFVRSGKKLVMSRQMPPSVLQAQAYKLQSLSIRFHTQK
jgi:hypothetical protein